MQGHDPSFQVKCRGSGFMADIFCPRQHGALVIALDEPLRQPIDLCTLISNLNNILVPTNCL